MNSQVLDLTKQLISIPSVKGRGNMHKIINIVDQSFVQHKGIGREYFEHLENPSVLYFNQPTRPNKFRLILSGHLDVVSAEDSQFKPRIIGNKLYGRGAYDMKSGVAAGIFAFTQLYNKLDYPIGLQLTTDEEVGGKNGTGWQLKQGVRSDFTIALEPSEFNIAVAAKGILWIDIESKGISSHGAYPWLGDNAITKLTSLLQDINKLFPIPYGKNKWATTYNLANIETTNDATNTIPNQANARIAIRYIPQDKTKVWESIKQLVDHYHGISIKKVLLESAHYVDPSLREVKLLQEITKNITGKNPQLIKNNGASDARY